MRHLISVVVIVVISAAAALVPSTASADPPERFELHFVFNFADFENGLVGFMNSDRATYCTPERLMSETAFRQWLDGGQVGPPPPEPFTPGFDPIQIQRPNLQSGAVLSHGRAGDLYFEVWQLDDVSDRIGVGPCLDTDDRAERFAVGTADWSFHGTDLGFTGTRALVFRQSVRGDVVDADGQRYRYRFDAHDNLTCSEHAVVENACLVVNVKLQPVQN